MKRDRLAWVDQNYVREDTLIAANAKLVAAQSRIDLAQAWGGGEVASADGLRFVVPVRTVHAGPNPKYFGTGRGVTWYNLVSDQFTGLHAITVPGTLRDSLILLAVLLEQLNRGEGRHSLARALFHGRRGELRQRYREGQEDQLGALGLVVNVIALWNTLYLEVVLTQLRQEGYPVRDEDVARLSPLIFEHINLLGRYSFTVPEAVIRGELRPLRDPAEEDI